MSNEHNNVEKIKSQFDQMRKRLDDLDKVLSVQERTIDYLDQKNDSLIKDANLPHKEASVEAIMKNVFAKGKLPKILQNNQEK